MKKILALLTACLMIAGLFAGCGDTAADTQPAADETEAAAPTQEGTEAPSESVSADAGGSLVIYASDDLRNTGVEQFREAYPGIEVEVVTAGADELCRKILEESEMPRCDVLLGSADILAACTECFEAYVCANDAFIDEENKDADDLWIGTAVQTAVIIYNKTLIDEAEVPATWRGLCDESLKGRIAYASPAESGTAYTQLCTMLFSQDTIEDGWALLENFAANLDGSIQDSADACHELVAAGEYAVGITTEQAAAQYAENENIGYVYPMKSSAVPEGAALIRNCANEENARLFIDFITGMEYQSGQCAQPGWRSVRSDVTPEELCALDALDLGDYDYVYAAGSRETILEQWNGLLAG